MLAIRMPQTTKIMLLQKHMVTNSSSLLLESVMPYYQAGLGNRLRYEITTNYYKRVINSSKTDAKYKITDISLEYEIVTQPDLARSIRSEYEQMVLLMTEFSGIDKL